MENVKILKIEKARNGKPAKPLLVLIKMTKESKEERTELTIDYSLFSDGIFRSHQYSRFYASIGSEKYPNDDGSLNASISSLQPSPNGNFYIYPDELRGMRFGSYILYQIILWLRNESKDETEVIVQGIKLADNDADNADNKERRNKLYENFGFKICYDNNEKRTGHSNNTSLSDLDLCDSWKKNITEYTSTNYIEECLHKIKELESTNNHLDIMIKTNKEKPIRFALRTIYNKLLKCRSSNS